MSKRLNKRDAAKALAGEKRQYADWERDRYRSLHSRRRQRTLALKWYKALFGKPPPRKHWILCYVRVMYWMDRKARRRRGRPLSEDYKQNYRAATLTRLSQFTPSMRMLLESDIRFSQNGGNE